MNGISDLLERYGTSLAETRKLMPRLTEAVKRQRAVKPPAFPQMPGFFTAEEAKEYGVELERGWMLKVTPGGDGVEPSISYITSTGWEITKDEGLISPEGKRYTREEYEAERAEVEAEMALAEAQMADPGYWRRLREWEEVERVFGRVFPEEDIEELLAEMAISPEMPEPERMRAEQAQDEFLRAIREIGRTEDTEELLRKMGASEEDLKLIFGKVDQVAEFGAITEEGLYLEKPWYEIAWNALVTGGRQLLHRTAQYFVSTLPNLAFKDVKPGERRKIQVFPFWAPEIGVAYTPEQAEAQNRFNQTMRDEFRKIYARNQVKNEEWIAKHPELQPPPRYKQDITQNLELLKEPGYWAYIIGDASTFSLSVLGTTLGVAFATKNPYLGLAAGTAMATPSQSQDLYEDLLASGAPEDKASEIAVPIGMVIALVEAVTDLPLLKAISPAFNLFKRNIQKAVVNRTMMGLFKRGVKTFTIIEVVESLEEVTQGAIHNAFVRTYDEDRQIFERVDETIIRTLMATSPFAIFGGGMSLRHVSPEVAQTVSPEDKKAQGWELDPRTGQWYKPEKLVDTFNENVTQFLEGDLTIDQAKLKALSEAARTPEGTKAIKEAAKKIKKGVPVIKPTVVEEVKPEITEEERVKAELYEMETELAGLKEWLETEPATKLVNLIKKTGWYKGEVSDLTPRQYRDIKGREEIPPSLLTTRKQIVTVKAHTTKLGKYIPERKQEVTREVVPWEYALDDIATEMGYESGEELKYAIEDAGKSLTRIKELEREIAVTEVPKPPEVKPVPIPKPPITEELKSLVSDIETEVEAAQVAIKGLTGDEAKVAREALKGLERELKYVKNTLESFVKRPDLPEATVLRSTIMAWARIKGLPKTQLQKIFSEVAGRRQLRVIPQEQLAEILKRVKEARPKTIRGKTVITLKTEKKIETLKDTLIRTKKLTEKGFNHLVEQLGLRATGYQSATKFITESEGKALIRAMNDEAVLAEWDIKVEESLARHPDIKEAVDGLNARSVKGVEVTFDGNPIRISRGNELRSMRYYVLKLQKELDAPIYDVWQKINMTHLTMRHKAQQLYNKLEQSTPEFRVITDDETALRRVEDYIASKHKMGPKAPPDITAEEVNLAKELEGQLFGFRNDVRYARFTEAYAGHSGVVDMIANDIPDAPRGALRRATDIFEGKGAEALRKFLDTQDWGIVKTGYDPRSIVKPRLYLFPAKATTFAKGHIQTREGIEYTSDDRTILQRYRSYTKQIIGLTDLAPLIRGFDRVFTEHAPKLADPRQVANVLSRGLNEMKGYREDGGLFVHMIERIYAQVAAAVFWRPDLVLRNKFQNWAFNPDFHLGLFMHPKNRFMSKERRAWFELFVTQNRGIIQDVLFREMKPIPGFGRLTRLANRTSGFPWSDHSNRAECFYVRMNRVDRALAQYEKDGDLKKLINNSGLIDFEPRQQAEALELLAMDSVDYGVEGMPAVTGKEAFARYNGQQLTNNVHFLYDRAQRAPAEMGATGKVLGNIFVFQRSWAERFLNQGNKLVDPKVSAREKFLALRIVVGLLVCGVLAGEAYRKITGKKMNPYNPLNILTYGPGGLMLGITESISNVMYLITQAVQGDEWSMGKLPVALAGVADLTLPFYKNLCQALEAVTDLKNIDVWAVRKIREMVDEEYEIRGGTHEVERTLLEKLQHALLAGVTEPPTPQEKAADAEEMLGSTIEEEDKPFSIEEPDIYDMRKLNTDLGRILRDIPVEDITEKNGYSTLAIAWVAKEASEATWQSYPSMPLYKINADPKEGDTFEEYYRQWQERKGIKEPKKLKEFDELYPKAHLGNISRRQYDLLKQYHSLEKPERIEFLEKHPELKLNPRNEWLKENPTDNARLAIWGQTKILTQGAYDEVQRLIKELDIPDDGIPEFTLPPEGSVENYFKYLEVGEDLGYNSWEVQLIIAQDEDLREFLERQPIETPVRSLELKVKHRDLFDQYDALGDKDSPLYIEDDEARDEARDKLKADNPEWVDDMRRIEAIEHEASDDVIEGWVERGRLVDEFNAGSSEVKTWLIDHPETFKWALDQELLTDDGSDWNVPVLRINAKWRVEDDEYEALETTEERLTYLTEHENYRKDCRRRDAYGLKGVTGEKFPEDQIENYVAYYEKPDKGYRRERYLIDNADFAKAMHEIAGIDLPDPKKIPAVGWDETYEKWKESFDRFWGFCDHKSEHYIEGPDKRAAERYKMRYDKYGNVTEFGKAEKRLDAYSLFVPKDLVETFVEYYTSSKLKKPDDWEYDYWYEDDWFLMEHPRFYQTMLDLKIWLEPTDFSKVPTRKVFELYKTYQGLPSGSSRFDFRAKHPDLDAWLVLKLGYKPIAERGEEKAKKTPWEEFEEVKRFQEKF